jgi:hypothetical protein
MKGIVWAAIGAGATYVALRRTEDVRRQAMAEGPVAPLASAARSARGFASDLRTARTIRELRESGLVDVSERMAGAQSSRRRTRAATPPEAPPAAQPWTVPPPYSPA